MTETGRQITRVWRLRPAALIFLVSLAVSCATMIQPPPSFLRAADNPTAQWLDTVVNVDVAEERIVNLPLTDSFSGMKLAIARADAPIESVKVSLHARQVTRRQALWLLAEKYGLNMPVERVRRQPPYISISRK